MRMGSIVSRLTLGDALRTSVLSKRWRCVSAQTIRALNFDASEIESKHLLSSLGERERGSADGYSYSEWVSGVLAQHRGPNVDEFRVCYDLDRRHASHIDGWIRFALSNRLHTLELTLSRKHMWHWLLKAPRWDKTLYTLQHPVWMSSNTFVGFQSLKTLSLNSVNVGGDGDEVVEHLLSNCPALERLSLRNIHGLRKLKVAGPSLLLSHLEVVACPEISSIEIYDTNLRSFTIVCPFDLHEVIVKNSPQLVELHLDRILDMGMPLDQFSCIYSQLQILQLTFYHGEGDGYWEYPMPVLENLKQFTLVLDFVDEDTLLGFLTTIKNWPNLEKFVLQIKFGRIGTDYIGREETEAYASIREKATFCHPCLKVVEIAGYCHAYHFDLFKQIIRNAVALERIILDTSDPDPLDPRPGATHIYRELQSGEEQQLRGLVPTGVELVIL